MIADESGGSPSPRMDRPMLISNLDPPPSPHVSSLISIKSYAAADRFLWLLGEGECRAVGELVGEVSQGQGGVFTGGAQAADALRG